MTAYPYQHGFEQNVTLWNILKLQQSTLVSQPRSYVFPTRKLPGNWYSVQVNTRGIVFLFLIFRR